MIDNQEWDDGLWDKETQTKHTGNLVIDFFDEDDFTNDVERMKYVTGSWKTYLLGTSKLFGKTQMKISTLFKKILFFAHLDKATIKPSCCEVSYP